jgi:hypothetical protein
MCHTPSPSHPSWFEHPNNIRSSVRIIEAAVIWSILDTNILLRTLFLNILNIQSLYSNLYLVLNHCSNSIQRKRQEQKVNTVVHAKNTRLGFHDTQGRGAPCLSSTRLIMSGVHKLKEQFGRRLHEKFLRHIQRRLSWVI